MVFLLYNSLSKKKEVFVPVQKAQVKMYCCGPTVYDFLHIGNFRGAVFFNFLRQWLEHKGYKVTYAYNFTDVDDKILARARRENKTMKEVADKYILEFKRDFKALKLREHDYNPQATQFIPEMIELISNLLDKGVAYRVDGDLFFSIESWASYGKLSRRKKEDLMSGARVEVDKRKKHPGDFALWKSGAKTEPGWDSPWGWGRPGWHLECTAMIFSLLGKSIDIHGGGADLIFPHHENELAQAEGAMDFSSAKINAQSHEQESDPRRVSPLTQGFVGYWVHNSMFTFGGEKMAKSVGNVHLMRDFLKEYNGEIFKYLVLSSHYRSLIEVSEKKILLGVQALSRIYTFLEIVEVCFNSPQGLAESHAQRSGNRAPSSVLASRTLPALCSAEELILKGLHDDLNTPVVFSVFFSLIRQFNDSYRGEKKSSKDNTDDKDQGDFANQVRELILKYGKIMSLFQEPPSTFLRELDDIFLRKNKLSRELINKLVAERSQARVLKDFKLADQIRLKLLKMNIEVQDTATGTKWETKKTNFIEEKL